MSVILTLCANLCSTSKKSIVYKKKQIVVWKYNRVCKKKKKFIDVHFKVH